MMQEGAGPRVERRLAAILAADVVGYSRLMGADEEGTLADLRAHRRGLVDPKIKEHRGRIVKTTGDGMLVEFLSPVEAVRCAVEIQRGMVTRNADVPQDKRITFRIGINLGDVIAETGDLFGDGVNVAARLEALCEPGGVAISRSVRDQVRDKLAFPLADLGERSVKNIARPVRVFGLGPAEIAALSEGAIPAPGEAPADAGPSASLIGWPARRGSILLMLAGLFAVLAMAGAVGLWFARDTRPTAIRATVPPSSPEVAASQPSVVIMPLANLSGDPAQDYFADGLTEDIISALGRFRDITVISRSAAFAYKGKSLRPDEIGRELNVAYVVDGSVHKTGDRARISVQLLEAARAAVLWTEQYDGEMKELFTIQEDITRRIAGALSVRLSALQLARSANKPPSNLEAYDLVLRGRDLVRRNSRVADSQARGLFERAIQLDQGYAPAYAALGRVDVQAVELGWTDDPDSALVRAEANGRKALSLEDENVGARTLLGSIYIFRRDYDRALDELRRAVEINPSDPQAQSGLADAFLWSGNTRGAIDALREVARVQPTLSVVEHYDLGTAYLLVDRQDEAIATLGHAIQRYEQNPYLHVLLAGAYAAAGRKDDAAVEAGIVRRMLPAFASKDFATLLRDEGQRLKIVAALQQAGL
ncbi:TolB amino-terminal domain-containing protein [Rhizobiales bacterium GAS188]|nr:TolB amino-terminal domain-containing protein [Rhizobiales bacterium GAS188]